MPSAAFGTTERELLVHIYGAMDEHDRGYVSFKQFVCALSTVFRGDKDDILEFWFRMYDSDHDGLLTKKVKLWNAGHWVHALMQPDGCKFQALGLLPAIDLSPVCVACML